MSGATIQTVLGGIAAADLGPCDAHEHLFLRSPVLPGEELVDRDLIAAEAALLAAAGAASVVDWTPIGLGRDPVGLQLVARSSGLHIVAATGFHRQAHYPDGHWVRREPVDELRALVTADLTSGIDVNDWCGPRERPTDVRAGVVKVGTGYWHASPLERKLIEASASAAVACGAPVCAHSEHGTFALELVGLLLDNGVAPDAIVVAHLDRNPDPGLHRAVAEAGVFLQYDGPGRAKYHPDSTILALIEAVAEAGHGDQLLLGGDTPRRSHLVSAGGGPGMAYPFATFLPRVRRELGDAIADRITVANPARAFALRAPR